jgi:hypothetical protein
MTSHPKIDSKLESERLLLVEGIDDRHAIFHLVRLVYRADPVFGIHECGSDDGVLDNLAARLVSSTPRQKILGLVLDADIEGSNSEKVIKSRLDQLTSRAGAYYPIPAVFPEEGLLLDPLTNRPDSDRLPRLGVWLMPNNKAFGMFEDLLIKSLPDDFAEYTTAVVKKAKVDGIAKFKDSHLSKAVIHTYLAWQDPPDIHRLGLAITRGNFSDIQSECKAFLNWIEGLFGSAQ